MPQNGSFLNGDVLLAFHLSQNYPNPFSGSTRITYCVAYKTRVRLTVLDSAGNVIDTLVDEEKGPGTYEVHFPARLSPVCQKQVPCAGKYTARLEAGEFSAEKEMEALG